MPRPRRLALAAATGVLVASGTGVALADGRCGSQSCRSDISVSGFAEPQPVKIGETSRLKFTIRNNGPDGTESTDFKTTIPEGLRIVRTQTYGGPSCSQDGRFVACRLGAFAAFQQMVVQVDVVGSRAQTFQVPANAYGYGSEDPNGGNGQVTVSLGVLTKSGAGGSGSSNAGGRLEVRDPQRPLRTGGVKVRVVTYATGTMRVRGRVFIGRGHLDLSSVTQRVRAGETKDVFLGTTTSELRRIRAALRGGTRLRTVISGSVGSRRMRTEIHLRR